MASQGDAGERHAGAVAGRNDVKFATKFATC